jgi:NADH dehydrogenase
MASLARVVLLGAGLAGVGALKKLQKEPLQLTVVDQNDYHSFLPLLYQVATGEVRPEHAASPIEDLLGSRNGSAFLQGRVYGIDPQTQRVMVEGRPSLSYDYLLVALGAVVNYFGVEGAQEYAIPLYTMDDANRVRTRVAECLQQARQEPGLIKDGVLDFCVVGGGATGVEIAGALSELLREELDRPDSNLSAEATQIHVVELQPELLTAFEPEIREYTLNALERRGISVHLGEAVTRVWPGRVSLRSGAELSAQTVIWTAGLQGHSLPGEMGLPLEKGRPTTNPDLSMLGHPEVFIAGDMALHRDFETNEALPQLGSVAQQAGARAGENIALLASGKATRRFEYKDKGTMAMIGRGDAVVQFRSGRTLTGKPAWAAWRAVHLMLLAGGEQKARTAVEWGRRRIGRGRRHL